MSGETPAMNEVSRDTSSRESLKPGMSSVTISTQNPIAWRRRIVSRIGSRGPPRALRFFEHRDRPLAGDQRFVVGAHDNARAQAERITNERFGRHRDGRRDRLW